MTATTTLDLRGTRRARPHGLDLVVMRISLAMLLWARRHANRELPTHEQQVLRMTVARDLARREHDSALRIARIF